MYSLTDSDFLYFHPTDKPICRPDQKKIYGVARNEAAEIVCEVDAFPPPENFKWSFNNTAETFDMPQSGFRPHSAQGSTLTYTPVKVSTKYLILCPGKQLEMSTGSGVQWVEMRDPFVVLNAKHVSHSIILRGGMRGYDKFFISYFTAFNVKLLLTHLTFGRTL